MKRAWGLYQGSLSQLGGAAPAYPGASWHSEDKGTVEPRGSGCRCKVPMSAAGTGTSTSHSNPLLAPQQAPWPRVTPDPAIAT